MSEKIISVKSAKYVRGKKDSGKMEIALIVTNEDNTHVKGTPQLWDRPVTQEIKTGLDGLRVHMGVLTGRLPYSSVKELDDLKDVSEDLVKDFTVSGFSIGGGEDQPGITLMGGYTGPYGHVTENSPFQRYESENYPLILELSEQIDKLETLVKSYMATPDAQLMLDFQKKKEESVTNLKIAHPEKPVFKEKVEVKKAANKGAGKRVAQSPEVPSGQVANG